MPKLYASDWAQIVSALATLATAIVAVIAARQSRESAKENRLTTEEMARPRVSIYVQSTEASKQLIDLIILNSGQSSARDISFKIVGDDLKLDHHGPNDNTLKKLRVIKNGIKLLEPSGIRKYYILSLINRYESLQESSSKIKVSYSGGPTKKRYTETFALDFGSLSESGWTTNEDRVGRDTVDELRKINRNLEAISRNAR
jgi:hypothetical protein